MESENPQNEPCESEEDIKQIIAEATKKISVDPWVSDAFLTRANAYYDLGEYKKAINDYTRAITINDSLVDAYVNRGGCYYEIRKYERRSIWIQRAFMQILNLHTSIIA